MKAQFSRGPHTAYNTAGLQHYNTHNQWRHHYPSTSRQHNWTPPYTDWLLKWTHLFVITPKYSIWRRMTRKAHGVGDVSNVNNTTAHWLQLARNWWKISNSQTKVAVYVRAAGGKSRFKMQLNRVCECDVTKYRIAQTHADRPDQPTWAKLKFYMRQYRILPTSTECAWGHDDTAIGLSINWFVVTATLDVVRARTHW